MNYRLIATQIGDLLKYDTSLNDIDRKATALFQFQRENFPHPSITSSRAKSVYDWIMSLAKQRMEPFERNVLLIRFCKTITPEIHLERVNNILDEGGVSLSGISNDSLNEFLSRHLHEVIHKHSKELYCQGHYFHAVFEACKAYNKLVQEKAKSAKDGQALMMEVWAPEGVLKITKCQTDTDKNVQNGIKFLAAGLMQAIRNPTAHEPALDWPIKKQDCLDLLSFLSFLLRQLDMATYYRI